MADRETLVYKSKLAEQAERYNDMVDAVKTFASLDVELTIEERNLLSVAYKNLVSKNRTAWRILTATAKDDNPHHERLLAEYIAQIEEELSVSCKEVVSLCDNHLIPAATTAEAKVFFYKMKGDYFRYIAEITTGNEKHNTAEQSLLAYKTASDLATAELQPTHPIRLGLALNFSVFYFEILNSPERACRLARAAFDDAIAGLDSLSEEENYKDATLIMQLLRDNLTLWSTDIDEKDVKEDVQDIE